MGVSIYYTARRSRDMSESEREAIMEVVRGHSVANEIDEYSQSGSGWNGEDFILYSPPFDSPDTILEGATKLPDQTDDATWTAIRHWCKAAFGNSAYSS